MSRPGHNAATSTSGHILEGTTLVLKVAREATDAVSIAKQILGAAAHISEYAEKIQKKRVAMYALVETSAIYSEQINAVVAEQAPGEQLARRLDRLLAVFVKIEALVAQEASIKTKFARTFHNLLTAPARAADLAAELEREMKLLQLTTALHTHTLAESAVRYDGQFRRLRTADIDKLDVITEVETAEGPITWARGRVDGNLMVLRYPEPDRLRVPEESTSGPPTANSANESYMGLMKRISGQVHLLHPNVGQLYGIGGGGVEAAFAAFKGGSYSVRDYVIQRMLGVEIHDRGKSTMMIIYKAMDGIRHVYKTLNLAIRPDRTDTFISLSDDGEPTVGLFDTLDVGPGPKLEAQVLWNVIITMQAECMDQPEHPDIGRVWYENLGFLRQHFGSSAERIEAIVALFQQYSARCSLQKFPKVEAASLAMSPDTVSRVHTYFAEQSATLPEDVSPSKTPSNMWRQIGLFQQSMDQRQWWCSYVAASIDSGQWDEVEVSTCYEDSDSLHLLQFTFSSPYGEEVCEARTLLGLSLDGDAPYSRVDLFPA